MTVDAVAVTVVVVVEFVGVGFALSFHFHRRASLDSTSRFELSPQIQPGRQRCGACGQALAKDLSTGVLLGAFGRWWQ